jgi:o-succinylbenzoate synthase
MLSLSTYKIPFLKPLKTGAGDFSFREGVILIFDDGIVSATSEVSPLPGFSKESFSRVLTSLKAIQSRANSFFTHQFSAGDLKEFLESSPASPSLQFGLSCLGVSILSKRKEQTLSSLFNRSPAKSLSVNYLIGAGTPDELKMEFKEGYNAGYRTFKFKAPHPAGELTDLLHHLADQYDGVRFRLDANRSWPADEATSILNRLKNLPVEYVEEPSRFTGIEELAELAANSPVPIAADESLETLPALPPHNKLIYIVKPALIGSIFKIHETILGYGSPVKNVVFTTALESGIGRMMAASAAVMFGDPLRAHGLATGQLLKQDIFSGPNLVHGKLSMDFTPFSSPGSDRINKQFLEPADAESDGKGKG